MFHAYGKAISRTALHRHRQSASWGACGRPPRPTRSRELPLAVPGKLTEICGALDLGIAPAAACALSMSTAPAGLGPPAMLMLVRTRMRVAMARSCWRCRAGLCFHAMLPARPHCHAYYELPCILYGDVGVTRSVKIWVGCCAHSYRSVKSYNVMYSLFSCRISAATGYIIGS